MHRQLALDVPIEIAGFGTFDKLSILSFGRCRKDEKEIKVYLYDSATSNEYRVPESTKYTSADLAAIAPSPVGDQAMVDWHLKDLVNRPEFGAAYAGTVEPIP